MRALKLAMQASCLFGLKSETPINHQAHAMNAKMKKAAANSGNDQVNNSLKLEHFHSILKLTEDCQQSVLAGHSDENNSFTVIVDTGCLFTCTNQRSDILPGTLKRTPNPIQLGGIAGKLLVEYCGQVEWETFDDNGNLAYIRTKAFLQEKLPSRLFSPQAYLSKDTDSKGKHLKVYRDRAELHLSSNSIITMDLDKCNLPRLMLFKSSSAETSIKALTGSLVTGTNINLDAKTKHWLRWHYRLGHLSFEHVRKLGLAGHLDLTAISLWKSELPTVPNCAACCYGKQARTPSKISNISQKKSTIGALRKDQLAPGDQVFSDQLESRVRGRLVGSSGREPEQDQYCGSTIFCDAASSYIHVEHQVSLSATDMIMSKNAFEQTARDMGVNVQEYHTDNGVYKAKAFADEIHKNLQSIRYSAVGAKWQNGIAENAIKIVSNKARTMMVHAAIHWPEVDDKSMWPFAVSYAAHLYNHTPNRETGISPAEVFQRTKSTHDAIKNAHPWGCPAYVLEPSLTQSG